QTSHKLVQLLTTT
nr:Chain B, Nuclear receptor coactivator 1 [Homo sapiens]3FEJ_B Chain B, peptide motif 3 of Nuclear receptor coactivator 1 [synthetic construct]3G9E_B Chain B, Nuclear receptor coactivator 1 [synthetic construct]